jgi:hypothetical protein
MEAVLAIQQQRAYTAPDPRTQAATRLVSAAWRVLLECKLARDVPGWCMLAKAVPVLRVAVTIVA